MVDEILGTWENDLDDGSGLHGIWGWAYEFKADGSGTYYSWDKQTLTHQDKFSWERIGDKAIRKKDTDDYQWETIEYSITIVSAPYSGRLRKLTYGEVELFQYVK
ncbi:hypothetical protein SIO70_01120 [Chitinophaga sancti]|uniref:hypothetical protein n=1 Tax=Chitinophaga sancti TaxID=1004 RepID=UPI002A751239|nr:hypothetical protein [Chitinophaga sancti]WPQ63464.1 hypothetical protein SIO70_01120 [Chitinophaga sancti]